MCEHHGFMAESRQVLGDREDVGLSPARPREAMVAKDNAHRREHRVGIPVSARIPKRRGAVVTGA
jgi:hypothetical protein